ncbi:MAG: aldolase catalytic domain-containing protein [Oscillospiraceae bacterium]|nr:aldolase catalytic domain-containing protein [Oscillospiraceae bacterium]
MERKGNLMTYRPDIKVFDATIRDGGLVNNFFFSDDFVKALYLANLRAGVDYMEMGYLADTDVFKTEDFGDWKFCKEENLRRIVGNNDTDLKLSVMADVGRTNLQRDLLPKSESVLDMVRVATYINTMPAAIEMIEYADSLGYETTCNIMAISKAKTEDIEEALKLLADSPIKAVYIVDSYGSLFPEQIQELTKTYLSFMEPAGKQVGIHAHNNQQMAFANTVESCSMGASFLDATVGSMGRGAGNCAMELLLGFLKNPKYNLTPILKFYEDYTLKLKTEEGLKWGYDIQYLLTGKMNLHPSSAIAFTKEDRKDYADFYHQLFDLEP